MTEILISTIIVSQRSTVYQQNVSTTTAPLPPPSSHGDVEISVSKLTYDDVFVFICLQTMGYSAIILNVTLIAVLVRYRHLTKASFVLVLNMAVSDVLHGLVTTSYFYPPIVLKRNHLPLLAQRLVMAADWTAWGITITHMSAVSIDRVIAVLMFAQYMTTMTPRRVKMFSMFCWSFFITMNGAFVAFNFCCLIVPQPSSDYYSFDFYRPSNSTSTNVYPPIYTPLEVTVMLCLLITTPTTLANLYKRHQRKQAMRRASAMLLRMSEAVTTQATIFSGEQAALAASRQSSAASRQQTRIFMQIITVTVIFLLYMTAYYTFFYVVNVTAKWAVVVHSFLYSFTHMINPVVYFCLNEEMRKQLKQMLCPWCKVKVEPPSRRPTHTMSTTARSSSPNVRKSTDVSPSINNTVAMYRNPIVSTALESSEVKEEEISQRSSVKYNIVSPMCNGDTHDVTRPMLIECDIDESLSIQPPRRWQSFRENGTARSTAIDRSASVYDTTRKARRTSEDGRSSEFGSEVWL